MHIWLCEGDLNPALLQPASIHSKVDITAIMVLNKAMLGRLLLSGQVLHQKGDTRWEKKVARKIKTRPASKNRSSSKRKKNNRRPSCQSRNLPSTGNGLQDGLSDVKPINLLCACGANSDRSGKSLGQRECEKRSPKRQGVF